MKNFDLTKIRNLLPHGGITEIAEKMGVDPRTVSEVLNEGWHKQHTNQVVSFALEILKRNNIDPAVIKEAAAMQLTTDAPLNLRNKKIGKKRKPSAGRSGSSKLFGGDMFPVFAAVAIGALLLLGKKQTTV